MDSQKGSFKILRAVLGSVSPARFLPQISDKSAQSSAVTKENACKISRVCLMAALSNFGPKLVEGAFRLRERDALPSSPMISLTETSNAWASLSRISTLGYLSPAEFEKKAQLA